MEDKIPIMPPQDYGLALLQESLLDNSAEKKRAFLEAKVEPYLSQFNAHSISEIEFIQSLVGAVYDVLLEKGANFSKDSVGLAGITEQNITGNCVLFNFALKLLLENYSFISHYWGLLVLRDMFSRYVHHFATLIELSDGEFYILDPVYKAHTKKLSLGRVETGKIIWFDTELETHQAIMVYPFKRLVLSQQNFWTGVNLYKERNYDAADKAFCFAMSMMGEQAGMLQTVFSSNLMDEMGRYGKINPEYTFSVGLVRYKKNRIEEAVMHFRFAQSMLPDNPDYSYYSALAYEDLGKLKEAIQFYKQFLALADMGHYGAVDVFEKVKSIEVELQSKRLLDDNATEYVPENLQSMQGVEELYFDFISIVADYAPVPPVTNKMPLDTHLADDLYFSRMDRVMLCLDLIETYQLENERFEDWTFEDVYDDTYYVGEIFEALIVFLLERIKKLRTKPVSTQEFISSVQEQTKNRS